MSGPLSDDSGLDDFELLKRFQTLDKLKNHHRGIKGGGRNMTADIVSFPGTMQSEDEQRRADVSSLKYPIA